MQVPASQGEILMAGNLARGPEIGLGELGEGIVAKAVGLKSDRPAYFR